MFIAGLLTTLLIFLILVIGTSWYYSDEIEAGAFKPDHSIAKPDVRILAVTADTIRLGPLPGTDKNGAWAEDGVVGLEFKNGYAQLGAILDRHPDTVVRELHLLSGQPAAGMTARANITYFPGDPKSGLGIDFQEVSVKSDIGVLPAWFVPGTRPTWIIRVHGKGSDRQEGLRVLSATHDLGYPFLDITYRNDIEAPATDHYTYGATEWHDLDAFVGYARANGATDVILYGSSMGGAIVLSFMQHSPNADRVKALVLNAPVIDFNATIDFAAHNRNVPSILANVAEWLTARRFGIDWKAMDYRSVAAKLKAPVLLIHGDADRTVPVKSSDDFAKSRPDLITYFRVEGAGHVRAWNHDPLAFDGALKDFLGRLPATTAAP